MHIRHRRFVIAMVGAAGLLAATVATTQVGHASGGLAFSQSIVGQYGGEPSLVSAPDGTLYVSSPSGATTFRGVTDHSTGTTSWTQILSPDSNSGDTCLNTDSSGALYWCNLNGSDNVPLQADVWKTTSPTTCTLSSCSWQFGNNATTAGTCSTSCNPFGVDRQWVASTIRPGQTTDTADVVLMYHDFYGPSHIWVNISHDGGKTFGTAQEVLSSPAVTPGAVTGTLEAEGYTFCNTIPSNVAIVPPGLPNAGRVYVAWIAADAATDGSGCNLTQAASYHTLWVSYSDDALTSSTPTWTPQMAYDDGVGHDASTPFASFTLDDQGNPYFGFNAPLASEVAPTCSAETTSGTQDPACSYKMQVVWANAAANGGTVSFGDGKGLIPGSASASYVASPSTEVGTDVMPTIAAGDPGQVDVSYLHTDTVDPTDPAGKFEPLGCDKGDTAATSGLPYPPRCKWFLVATQSLNLTADTSTATWSTPWVSNEMHYGDICNLGIACAQSLGAGSPVPRDPRDLLDFNMETIDPTTGCAHIAYADDNYGTNYGDTTTSPYGNHVVSADQTTNCLTLTSGPGGNVPEAPLAALLLPAAAAAFIGTTVVTRRRRNRAIAA